MLVYQILLRSSILDNPPLECHAEDVEEVQKKEITTVETSNPERVIKTTTVSPAVKTEHPQQVFEKKKAIFRMHQIIWYILAVIEILLGFRMTLKALGANPYSAFTSIVYTLSSIFAIPFTGILPTSVSGNSVIEWSTIIAGLVYLLVAWGIVHLLLMLKPVTPQEVSQNVDNV